MSKNIGDMVNQVIEKILTEKQSMDAGVMFVKIVNSVEDAENRGLCEVEFVNGVKLRRAFNWEIDETLEFALPDEDYQPAVDVGLRIVLSDEFEKYCIFRGRDETHVFTAEELLKSGYIEENEE